MKKICTTILIFLPFLSSNAQSNKKTLFGNFVLDKQVFQYQYERDAGIHSLKLTTLNKPDNISSLDTTKINNTIKQLDSLSTDTALQNHLQILDLEIDTVSKIKVQLQELKKLRLTRYSADQQIKKLESFIEFAKVNKIDEVDTTGIKQGTIYGITDLLSIFRNYQLSFKDPVETDKIPFDDLNQEVFRPIFKEQVEKILLATRGTKNITEERMKDRKADEILYAIKARVDFDDNEPVTAFLNLKRTSIDIEVPIYYETKIETKSWFFGKKKKVRQHENLIVHFKLRNISVEFEDGTVKHVFADLEPDIEDYKKQYGTTPIRFRNLIPISVSGKFDPDAFARQAIFIGNSRELMNSLRSEAKRRFPSLVPTDGTFTENNNEISFRLSDFLDYVVVPESNNEDYSPTNSIVSLSETKTTAELKKEKRSKILDARIYTDFIGLNEEQPNGLVQVEVSRKINVLTGREQLPGRGYIYAGGLTFIRPRFTLSKIEQDNRYYLIDSFAVNREKSLADSQNHFNLNPLEVLRYQQWSLGLDINFGTAYFINKKVNFQLNGSVDYARTPIADSIKISNNKINLIPSRNISKINSTMLGISAVFEVKPDSRWGFTLGQDIKWQKVFDNRFEFDRQFNNFYFNSWLLGYMKTSNESNAKIFFRFKKYWLRDNANYNFYQIQLGYELDLFGAGGK